MRYRIRALTVAALVTASSVTAARAQLVPLGGQFEVNSYTTNLQGAPAVSANADGSFVVVWSGISGPTDPSGHGVQGQRYDLAGATIGGEFQVNAFTTSYQSSPDVAVDPTGGFVVVWSSDGSAGSDGSGQSIQARLYDAAGVPLAADFQVNEYTTGGQASASVAVDGAGGFVVVWSSTDGDGSSSSVRGRRFDATGAPLGGDFQVNTYVTGSQYAPDVATGADGSFVVVWTSEFAATDASAHSVHGQRYAATGSPSGPEFQVNSYTTGYQVQPAVGMTESGSFVVAWQSNGGTGTDTSSYRIHAQRFDAAGSPSGAEFQVNTYGTGAQVDPVIAPLGGAGGFVVAWNSAGSAGSDTSGPSIQARRLDATGTPVGDDFQVNAYVTGGQASPVVAADDIGSFVVTWASDGSAGSDTSSYSVQGQRFAVARSIRGKNILVKDPTGDEERRTVILFAKENPTDIGPFLGDPVADGATLRVITRGNTDSDQTYLLNAAGWSALGSTGWKYSGPTGGDGDPVKKVLLKQTPGGTALLKVILKGSVGTQGLAVVPPNSGDEGGLIFELHGGVTLCGAFGGAAGGTEVKDDGRLWKLKNATADGCPSP